MIHIPTCALFYRKLKRIDNLDLTPILRTQERSKH